VSGSTARRLKQGLIAGLIALAWVADAANATDAGLYLSRIPAERAAGAWSDPGGELSADLFAADGSPTHVAVPHHATLPGDPGSSHKAASFVIDYDEPEFVPWLDALRAEHGAAPGVEELVAFVDARIPEKTYRHGFNVASQVAASGEGDCTEHAVALTALARAQGRPARVVFGLLLIDDGARLATFGHAWSEIHDGGAWRIADATRPARLLPEAHIRYLPPFPPCSPPAVGVDSTPAHRGSDRCRSRTSSRTSTAASRRSTT
jgi:hypothetical protein